MRRGTLVAGGLLAAGALAAGVAIAADTGPGAPAPAPAATGATATVERRDLVDRETLDGTLGFAGDGDLAAGAAGTLTNLRAPGAVVRRGGALYSLDGASAAWLLYGRLPAWRDLTPGMADGEDVRQLERNLVALGHDPEHDIDVDDEWDRATTAAVERFQAARGLTEHGSLAQGEIVFRHGPTRIGEPAAAVGDRVAPGRRIGALTSTRREVVVDLDARRGQLARAGDRVTVELPTGRTARGRIAAVGKVAEQPPGDDGGDPTIEVRITLRGKAARGSGLDQAPVDVGFAVERRQDVLTVPIKALLAREGGGFAVEVEAAGTRRLVPVVPGVDADDLVEVAGDLHPGEIVVTAR